MNARATSTWLVLLVLMPGCSVEGEPAPQEQAASIESTLELHPDSDSAAVEVARGVMQTMGGREAWNGTRHVSWTFFGGRRHWWDRETGDVRIEARDREENEILILMNVRDLKGRVWINGAEQTESEQAEWLSNGHQMWVNDSYWVFMPYKLLDPGVRLEHAGERAMEDGRTAEVLVLTFDDGVGYTPRNKYEVFVAEESGLVEQWAFYGDADDPEPRFTMPWHGWERFGTILIATDHGRDHDWEIAVHDDLPRSVFDEPAPVNLAGSS